jgi:hypothetical protein
VLLDVHGSGSEISEARKSLSLEVTGTCVLYLPQSVPATLVVGHFVHGLVSLANGRAIGEIYEL